MSTRPPVAKVISGHMTHTRVRRVKGDPYEVTVDVGIFTEQPKKVTKHRPGRTFVEVLVWEGPEATGEPLAEWELPHELRYSLDEAARLAVAQTRFPAVSEETPPKVPYYHPDDPNCDHTEVTFTLVYRRAADDHQIRLSGRDARGKLQVVQRAIRNEVDQPVWLHVHRAAHGVREPWSDTMSMLFTINRLMEVKIEEVETVIEEDLGE